MAQSLAQPSPIHKIIRAAAMIKTNTGLLVVGMVLLVVMFGSVLLLGEGPEKWIFGLILLFAMIGILGTVAAAIWRDASTVKIPYSEEYMLELPKSGHFYGDEKHLHKVKNTGQDLKISVIS